MMAAQKKPVVARGPGGFAFSGSIRSELPAREPLQTVIYGKSFQTTVPTLTAPVAIQGISGTATVSDGGGRSSGFSVPELHGVCLGAEIPDAVLASGELMGGVWHDGTDYWISDTYEPCVLVAGTQKSRLVRRCRSHVFEATDSISIVSKCMEWTPEDLVTGGDGGTSLPGTLILSSHFPANGPVQSGESVYISGASVRVFCTRMQNYILTLWKSWIRRESSSGRPFTIVYASDTPETALGYPVRLGSFSGQTVFSFTGTAQPYMKAGLLTHR